jgi:hypothetical protein
MEERKVAEAKTGQETIPETVSHLQLVKDFWARYGNIGPPAKSAIPRLEKMFPEADCMDGVATSANGIRYALKRMGVKPSPPPGCIPRAA